MRYESLRMSVILSRPSAMSLLLHSMSVAQKFWAVTRAIERKCSSTASQRQKLHGDLACFASHLTAAAMTQSTTAFSILERTYLHIWPVKKRKHPNLMTVSNTGALRLVICKLVYKWSTPLLTRWFLNFCRKKKVQRPLLVSSSKSMLAYCRSIQNIWKCFVIAIYMYTFVAWEIHTLRNLQTYAISKLSCSN